MIRNFFVGIDGGASKCIIRIEDEDGDLIGETRIGPVSMRLSARECWQRINAALAIFLGPTMAVNWRLYGGFGLAGCELSAAYQEFIATPHPFTHLWVGSDAQIACSGAHAGQDGAIISIGTGLIGWQQQLDTITRVGGFGFPHDDRGGGAWLGLDAVHLALQAYDGRIAVNPASTTLLQTICNVIGGDVTDLISWVNYANATQFAQLAPYVIELAAQNNPLAISCMQRGADAITQVGLALRQQQRSMDAALPLALVGGLADFFPSYLPNTLSDRLIPPKLNAVQGALLLARKYQSVCYSPSI